MLSLPAETAAQDAAEGAAGSVEPGATPATPDIDAAPDDVKAKDSMREVLGDDEITPTADDADLPKVELAPPTRQAPTDLEEITVLGRRRGQELQETPVSVTVFNEMELRQRSIDSIDQIALSTPNLEFAPIAGTSNEASVYLRGIGQNDSIVTADPGVGIYVDGVYIGRAVGALFDLFDTERVEVISGPQGSKFGKNTIGGAINVISRKPSGEFGITGRVTVGEYSRLDGTISIEGPIIGETLSGRVTMHTANRDGYVEVGETYGLAGLRRIDPENSFTIADVDKLNDKNQLAGRATLTWLATDNVTIDYSFDKTRDRPESVGFDVLFADPNSGILNFSETLAEVNPSGCLFLGVDDCTKAQQNDPYINVRRYNQFGDPNDPTDPFKGQGFPKIAGLSHTRGCAGNVLCILALPPGQQKLKNPGLKPNQSGDAARVCFGGSCYDRALNQDYDVVIDDDPLFASVDFDRENNLDLYGHSLQVQWDINESLTLRSVSGYRTLDSNRALDVDGTAFTGLHSFVDTRQWQFSQELFLVGRSFNDRFRWQTGVFYFQEHADGEDRIDVLSTVIDRGRKVICALENDIRLDVKASEPLTAEEAACPRIKLPKTLESESKRALTVIRGLTEEKLAEVVEQRLRGIWVGFQFGLESEFREDGTFCGDTVTYRCDSSEATEQMYYFYPVGQFGTYDGPHCSPEAAALKGPRKVNKKFQKLCNFDNGAKIHQGGFTFRGAAGGDPNKGNALGCPFGSIVSGKFDDSTGTGCRDARAENAKATCEAVTGVECIDGYDQALNTVVGTFFPLANLPEETDFEIENVIDNYAMTGYVSGTLEVTDRLTVDAGLRLSWEKKEIFRNQKTLPSETLVIANAKADESWTDLLPSLTIQYQFTPDLMGFAKISKGFKTGGFNGRALDLSGESTPQEDDTPEELQAKLANAQSLLEATDPEELWSLEFGARSQWLDNRLTFNFTAFYNIYSQIQLNTQGLDRNGNFTNRVDNAGKAIMQGLEMNLVALPFPGIFLDGSIALNHGRYLEYDQGRNPECADLTRNQCELRGDSFTLDGSNLKLPRFPGLEFATGITFVVPMPRMTGGGRVSLRGDYAYRSKLWLNAANTLSLPPRGIYNARISWSNDDDWLSLAFYVRNLMDKEYLVTGLNLGFFGLELGQYGPPRMWGLEAIVEY